MFHRVFYVFIAFVIGLFMGPVTGGLGGVLPLAILPILVMAAVGAGLGYLNPERWQVAGIAAWLFVVLDLIGVVTLVAGVVGGRAGIAAGIVVPVFTLSTVMIVVAFSAGYAGSRLRSWQRAAPGAAPATP